MGGQVQDLEAVLGLAGVVLLLSGGAGYGVGGQEDARAGAVTAGAPGALGGEHVAVGIEFGGVLAEVPDVSGGVLGVVVAGGLVKGAVGVETVLDDPAGMPVIFSVSRVTVRYSVDLAPSLLPL